MKSLTQTKQYKTSINFWSLDILRLPNPEVPVSAQAVRKLREHHFRHPSLIPMDIVVAVSSVNEAVGTIGGCAPVESAESVVGGCAPGSSGCASGGLRVLSAPEMLLAYLQAIAMAVDTDNEALLAEWRDTMLCCPVHMKLLQDADEIHITSVQLREDLVANYASMRLTAVQKMFDVKSVRDRRAATTGATTAAAIADHYKKIRWGEGSEVITAEFVDCALTVLNRMMAIPLCSQLVRELDDMGVGNPLNSIHKLHKIVTKAQTPEKIEWTLSMIIDLYRSGGLKSDQLAVRHLTGNTKSSGKGLVDLLCYKRDCLVFLTHDFLDCRPGFPEKDKTMIRSMCHSVQSFRHQCGHIFNYGFYKAPFAWLQQGLISRGQGASFRRCGLPVWGLTSLAMRRGGYAMADDTL